MAPINLPDVPLKVFVFGHFVLCTWGFLLPVCGDSYLFSNYFAILMGVWALKEAASIEPVQYFLVVKLFTILNDVICLAIWFQGSGTPSSYKFSAAMIFINLLIKPLSCLFIYKEWQARGGESSAGGNNYQDIDSNYGKPPEPMP